MGLSKKSFLIGFGCCAFLLGCAAFPYHYYAFDYQHGTLVGATPKDDLPVVACAAIPGTQYPCMIVKTSEFFKLKADYLKAHQDLQDCQNGNPPTP